MVKGLAPACIGGRVSASAEGDVRGVAGPCNVVDQQCARCTTVVGARDGAERLLPRLYGHRGNAHAQPGSRTGATAMTRYGLSRTVSQICSLICLLSMVIMRAPNSTPMVKSCTGWKRLSVNCRSKHDFPTPVSPMMMYLSRRSEAQG